MAKYDVNDTMSQKEIIQKLSEFYGQMHWNLPDEKRRTIESALEKVALENGKIIYPAGFDQFVLDIISPVDKDGKRLDPTIQTLDDVCDAKKMQTALNTWSATLNSNDPKKQNLELARQLAASKALAAGFKADNSRLEAGNSALETENVNLRAERDNYLKSNKRCKKATIATIALSGLLLLTTLFHGIGWGVEKRDYQNALSEANTQISVITDENGNLIEQKKKHQKQYDEVVGHLQQIGYDKQDDESLKQAVENAYKATLEEKQKAIAEANEKLEESLNKYEEMVTAITQSINDLYAIAQIEKPSEEEVEEKTYYNIGDFQTITEAIEFLKPYINDPAVNREIARLQEELDKATNALVEAEGKLDKAKQDLEKKDKELQEANDLIDELQNGTYSSGVSASESDQSGTNVTPVSAGDEEDGNQNKDSHTGKEGSDESGLGSSR